MKRQGAIRDWHDREITAGEEWDKAIDEHLESAHIILLLISADFLASDFRYDVVMKRAMERHKAGEASVIPIILREVDWRGAPFGKLQALPKDAKPVTSWSNIDEAFTDIAKGIRRAVEIMTGAGAVGQNKAQTRSVIWNVPHGENQRFVGRDQLLDQIHKTLSAGRAAALTAIHGLGGVGKTQLAAHYAHRHKGDYQIVWWIKAEEPATLAGDYAALATALNLPEKEVKEQPLIVAAVRRWLEQHPAWLLIFDNARDGEEIRPYLPQGRVGHALITSRDPNWRGVASPLEVRTLLREDAARFLLERAGQSDEVAARALAAELGDLPLALEQAGAYLEETGETLTCYTELFRARRRELQREERPPAGYPDTVATAWLLSFQQAEQQAPVAVELMRLCAFLAPDGIPLSMLRDGQSICPTLWPPP
jgi:hypothetical protein